MAAATPEVGLDLGNAGLIDMADEAFDVSILLLETFRAEGDPWLRPPGASG